MLRSKQISTNNSNSLLTNNQPQEKTEIKSKGCFTGIGFLGGLAAFPILIVILILILCTICGVVSYIAYKKIDWEKLAENSDDTQEFDNPCIIGETVNTKNVAWKILSVNKLGDSIDPLYSDLTKATTDGQFIKIQYSIRNNENEAISPAEPVVVDSEKREYAGYTDSEYYIENRLVFMNTNINPGIEKNFEALYELPRGLTALKLKVTGGGLFTPEIKYIDLEIE